MTPDYSHSQLCIENPTGLVNIFMTFDFELF